MDELGMLLNDLAAVMKAGCHSEWAAVFGHFGHELAHIQGGKTWDSGELRRLVRSIQMCFEGSNGFTRLYLEGKDAGETASLNTIFAQLKAKTARALEEIELRFVEFLN